MRRAASDEAARAVFERSETAGRIFICKICPNGYNAARRAGNLKPLFWVGSSKKDLKEMPASVVDVVGYALYLAQNGLKHRQAKPLKGFGSAGVLEVVEDNDGSAYRAVYTVRFSNGVYVLHCFQKKSRKGIETSKQDKDMIAARLKLASRHSEGA